MESRGSDKEELNEEDKKKLAEDKIAIANAKRKAQLEMKAAQDKAAKAFEQEILNDVDSSKNLSDVRKTLTPFENDILNIVLDSINKNEIMYEPVLLPCGDSFSRDVILDWLNSDKYKKEWEDTTHKNDSCPVCRATFKRHEITKNTAINITINTLFTHRPELRKFQRFNPDKLLQLIKANNVEEIKLLLTDRQDKLNEIIQDGGHILHMAVNENKLDIVKLLIDFFQVNINARTIHQETALHIATKNHVDIAILKYLVEKNADLTLVESRDISPFLMACFVSKLDKIQFLIESKKNLNMRSKYKYTAFIAAFKRPDITAEIATALLSIPDIDINEKDYEGQSALFWVCRDGFKAGAEKLLAMPNIDVEAARIPGDGKRAIEIALENGRHSIVQLFRTSTVKLTLIKNKLRDNNYEIAAQLLEQLYKEFPRDVFLSHLDEVEKLDSSKFKLLSEIFLQKAIHYLILNQDYPLIIKFCKQNSDKINLALIKGQSILHLAIKLGDLNLIKLLFDNFPNLDVNAKINGHDDEHDGRTALYLAMRAKKSNIEIVNYLIDLGADAGIPSKKNTTPLLAAIANGYYDRANSLIALSPSNLNIDLRDDYGDSALTLAAKSNCNEVFFSNVLNFADASIPTNNGETALFILAEKGNISKLCELLKTRKVDFAAKRPSDGMTALEIAKRNKHKETVALLKVICSLENILCDRKNSQYLILSEIQVLSEMSFKTVFIYLENRHYQKEKLNPLQYFLARITKIQTHLDNSAAFFIHNYQTDFSLLSLLLRSFVKSDKDKICQEAFIQFESFLEGKDKEFKKSAIEYALVQDVIQYQDFLPFWSKKRIDKLKDILTVEKHLQLKS